MQKNSTLIHDLTPDEIASLFLELKNQLADIKQNFQPKIPNKYITREAVAEKLSCDLSTVHNWTAQGKLKKYGIGNRVYYKLHEVEAALIPLNCNE